MKNQEKMREFDTDRSSRNSEQERQTTRRSTLKMAGVAGIAGLLTNGSAVSATEDISGQFDPIEATVTELYDEIVDGDLTAREVTEMYLDRIDAYDEMLNTLINVNMDALSRAEELDKALTDSGPVGPLHGVPLILKDNFDTTDMPTSAGSQILEESVPPEDGFVVELIRDAGGIVLGKGNMDEWSHGGAPGGGYSSLGDQTLNPYHEDRGPDGSSGGPAAATAANLVPFGMGTDTGGSIRGPVAANGLVGIKPTFGLVSRTGIVPFALSLDVPGPMTKSVADAATILNVIAEPDPDDPDTYEGVGQIYEDYTECLQEDGLSAARVGLLRDGLGGNSEVDEAVETAINAMEQAGAVVIDRVELPEDGIESVDDIYYPIAETELKHYLADYFDGLDDPPVESLADVIEISLDPDFPIAESVLERLESAENRGSLADDFYQRTLESGQEMLRRIVDDAMIEHDLDALIVETNACPAEPVREDPEFACEETPFRNAITNITGYPEVSVPAGFTDDDLPFSISFLGQPFSEPTLLELAYSYEQATAHRAPPNGFGAL